jgi:hypothetical protein
MMACDPDYLISVDRWVDRGDRRVMDSWLGTDRSVLSGGNKQREDVGLRPIPQA